MLCNPDTRQAASNRILELGIEVWEQLNKIVAALQENPLQHLNSLYHADIALQALSEQRIKDEWKVVLSRRGIEDVNETEAEGTEEEDMECKDEEKKIQRKDLEVEEGAILLASWEHSRDLDIKQRVYKELDTTAELVKKRLREEHSLSWDGTTILEMVNKVLYHEIGFHGEEENYYDPSNRYLIYLSFKSKAPWPCQAYG